MILVLQRDDAERRREGVGEAGDEAVRDLAPERGAAEDARELAPLASRARSRSASRRPRRSMNAIRKSTSEAAAAMSASSRKNPRRASARSGARDWSITIVQPGIADVL